MKKIIMGILILTIVSGCGNKEMSKKVTVQDIKVDAVHELIEDKNYTIIDVRTESEYEEESLPGAILVPLDELENKISSVVEDKNQNIIVYCQSGNRSKTASEILISLGYTSVYNMVGEILAYPYETE